MSRSFKTDKAREKHILTNAYYDTLSTAPENLSTMESELNQLQVALNRHGNNRKSLAKDKVRERKNERRKFKSFQYEE